ncbi:unknown [Roseburia intestinalis CAG:13]|nr:unknown [Roseburia intestinalis CAG:13]
MAAPSVPSCSSSPVQRTSCCRNIRCYISLRNGTGRSDCKDMDTPMSLCHRSYHGVRSADVFRSSNHFHRNMRSDHGKDEGSLRYHCLPLYLQPVHVCSVWMGSMVPMGRHQIMYTRSCCRCDMPSGLPPSR